MSKQNFTQEITLPSRGFFNPEIPEGKVVQRCMMVSDQKFLAGSSQSSGGAINQIIQETIVSPESFDVAKLTLADSLYLLFKLRVLSYGNKYKFRTRCPECGKKIELVVDFSELPVTMLEENYEEKLVVTLPHRGDKVYTRLLTNQDIKSINDEIKRRKKKYKDYDGSDYALRIAYSIDKIELKEADADGKTVLTSNFDIEQYINELTDLDASTIIATRDSVDYGISPVVEQTCPECGEFIEIGIQFSGDFFRPTIG